jgi:hypothetical protein
MKEQIGGPKKVKQHVNPEATFEQASTPNLWMLPHRPRPILQWPPRAMSVCNAREALWRLGVNFVVYLTFVMSRVDVGDAREREGQMWGQNWPIGRAAAQNAIRRKGW